MTTFQTQTWESALLSLASEAGHICSERRPTPAIWDNRLESAYSHCSALTAEHSQSFYLASALLPNQKRRAMRALYAFCRQSDNIVDMPGNHPQEQLQEWRKVALSGKPPQNDLVALAWFDARQRFGIPTRYAEQLLDGVGRALIIKRYQTFDELAAYAYGVASTVGLMSMHITGFNSAEAIPYAIKLGVALQLTNILRDIGQDWRMGRVYLPQVELDHYGLDESDLAAGFVNRRWRAFMRFQIDRNRRLYCQAWPGIAMLDGDGRFAVAAASSLYQMILDEIENNDYDVFTKRAYASKWRKLTALPGIWHWSRLQSHPQKRNAAKSQSIAAGHWK